MLKKMLVLILTALMLLSLTACGYRYGGRHTELHSVAIHSLLGVRGHEWEDTFILEEDDFGRAMFSFLGRTIISEELIDEFNILSILIVQRTTGWRWLTDWITGSYAYFYSGINFISTEVEGSLIANFYDLHTLLAGATGHFSEEQIAQLKEENDWNREIDENRLFRVRTSRRIKESYMTYVPEEAQRKAFAAVSQTFHPRSSVALTMDANGNVIYFMKDARIPTRRRRSAYLFMFDRDGNLIPETGTMHLPDEYLWDYREILWEFKEANGWSFSYRG